MQVFILYYYGNPTIRHQENPPLVGRNVLFKYLSSYLRVSVPVRSQFCELTIKSLKQSVVGDLINGGKE